MSERPADSGVDRTELRLWRALGTIYGGWAKAQNTAMCGGQWVSSAAARPLIAPPARRHGFPYIGAPSRTCEIAGQLEEGLSLLDEALPIMDRTAERWYAAELNRRKASCCCVKGMRGR